MSATSYQESLRHILKHPESHGTEGIMKAAAELGVPFAEAAEIAKRAHDAPGTVVTVPTFMGWVPDRTPTGKAAAILVTRDSTGAWEDSKGGVVKSEILPTKEAAILRAKALWNCN